MSVLVLQTAEPDAEILAVYATAEDLFNDWPGKSWMRLGEAGWHDGAELYANPVPWYEQVVPVHLRGDRAAVAQSVLDACAARSRIL